MMAKLPEQQRKKYRSLAIILILLGVITLLLNQLDNLPWTHDSLIHLLLVYGSILLVFISTILWILSTYDASHGDWILGPATRRNIITVGVACLILGTATSVANQPRFISGSWTTILSILSILFNAFWLFMALISVLPSAPAPIGGPEPPGGPKTPEPPPVLKRLPKDITASPPSIDPKVAQHYEQRAKEVYTKLTKTPITAIALTSLSDNSTTTLAAAVYREAKRHREAGDDPFEVEELWLHIDPDVTVIDILGTIFKHQNKILPELADMSLANQARALLDVLDTPEKSRLIVLDRCEHWLSKVKESGSGVQELLNALDSPKCKSKIVLTCRSLPHRNLRHRFVYLQEYPVPYLEIDVKRGASTTDDLFEEMYMNDLNYAERVVISAFSVYRTDVPLVAAQAQINFTSAMAEKDIRPTVDALLSKKDWLVDCGRGRYRVETKIAECAQRHFMEYANDLERQRALRAAHVKAAHYYEREAEEAKKSGFAGTPLLIEAIWHWCQIQKWGTAYSLAKQEALFFEPKNKQDAETLRGVCLLFLPLDKWHPGPEKAATIYYYQKLAYDMLEENK